MESKETSLQTLRIPRGLWDDLETTIIQQDRQFLTDVARAIGLPVMEVLKKCLGTGLPTAVHVLTNSTNTFLCPWWIKIGELWEPCGNRRLTQTSSCHSHQHVHASPTLCLESAMDNIPEALPVRYNKILYWWCETTTNIFQEDGTIVTHLEFRYIPNTTNIVVVIRN